MPGNWQALFGKGPTEQDPNGHLAGGLLHSEGGVGKRAKKQRALLLPYCQEAEEDRMRHDEGSW